ncbi:MAG: InlB B-repeat-containing protein [Clostridiales bacterium]|nr:InlB B-repeat-containing protein [Clostridiales bacterium]
MRKISLLLSMVMIITMLGSAVYAGTQVTDTLTYDKTLEDPSVLNTYREWTYNEAVSEAVYAGQSAINDGSIQLRSKNSNSGIVTTTSPGYISKITVTWNSTTETGRTLDVYGKSSAYTDPTNLYSSDPSVKGTLLGSIVYGTDTELTISGSYQYVGVRSASGAMYLDDISFTWDSEASSGETEEATVSFDANGGSETMPPAVVTVGKSYKLPRCTFTAPEGKRFLCWMIDGITYDPNESVTITKNTTVVAQWVDEDAPTVNTDLIDLSFTQKTSSSYAKWEDMAGVSGTVYAGFTAGNGNNIQINSSGNNKGIISTTSIGKAKKVTIRWGSNTPSTAVIDIYGSASGAYSSPSDLYSPESQGTLIGSISCGDETTLTIPGDYYYIGIRSRSGVAYIYELTIEWLPAELPDPYQVLFDSNGGSGSMAEYYIRSSYMTLPDNGFTAPAGTRFGGWQLGDKVYNHGIDVPISEDTVFRAVWTDISGNTIVTDTVDHELTGVTGSSLTEWADRSDHSGTVYAGSTQTVNNKSTKISDTNAGIITTASGGFARSISADWSDSGTNIIRVYGKHTPYSSVSDLFDTATAGDYLGRLTTGASSLTIDPDYEYIGIRSQTGNALVDSIMIDWEATCELSTISFDTGDGTAASGLDIIYLATGSIFEIPHYDIIPPEGKSFAGWQINGTSRVVLDYDKLRITEDTVLTAVYTDAVFAPDIYDGDTRLTDFDNRSYGGMVTRFRNIPEGTIGIREIYNIRGGYTKVIVLDAYALNHFCFGKDTPYNDDIVDVIYLKLPAGYVLTGDPRAVTGTDKGFVINGVDPDDHLFYKMDPDGTYSIPDRIGQTDCTYAVKAYTYGTYTATAALNEANTLQGFSASIADDISMNLYMSFSDDVRDSLNAYMLITTPDGSTSRIFIKDIKDSPVTVNGQTCYSFSCPVSAKDMSKKMTAQLYVDGYEFGDEISLSVKDYATYIYDHRDEEGYSDAVPLVIAMLNYGTAAQEYFGVDTNDPANGYLDPEDIGGRVVNAEEIDKPFDPVMQIDHLPEGTTFYGASLSLKSRTTLSLYFTSDRTLHFRCASHPIDVSGSDGVWIVRIRNIDPCDLDSYIELQCYTLEESGTISYCPLTYCYNVLSRIYDNAPLRDVCSALYLYHLEAKSYKENHC